MTRSSCRRLTIAIARATSPEEVAEAAQVYSRSRRAAFPWRSETDFDPAHFVRDALEEAVTVARLGTRIVGVASVYTAENFLHSLYVDPDAQGLGVGRTLIDHVRAHATGPLTLKLDVKNEKARGFYEAHGWEAMTGPDDTGIEDGLPWQRYRLP